MEEQDKVLEEQDKVFMPVRVSTIDTLNERGGIERGSTILLSGGCGVGKTIFALQSVYNGALNNEKSVYITLAEDPEKIKKHAKMNFGWDVDAMEKSNMLKIIKMDPFEVANDISSIMVTSEDRSLSRTFNSNGDVSLLDSKRLKLPFQPDRIIVDSLSALSSTFSSQENYRMYFQVLIDALNKHNSVNFLISELEQEPNNYIETGVEEFLVDGVVVMYGIRKGQLRRHAIEILKLRCSDHVKEMVPYMITGEGIKLHIGEKIL